MEYVPTSLDALRYTIVLMAKARGIDPDFAILVAGCVGTLLASILIASVAEVVVRLSAVVRWLCYAALVMLASLFVLSFVKYAWDVPEVTVWRCGVAEWLAPLGAWPPSWRC